MKFFHVTRAKNATNILKRGFRDTTGNYMMNAAVTGVWVSEKRFQRRIAQPRASKTARVECPRTGESIKGRASSSKTAIEINRNWSMPNQAKNSL